MHRETIVLGGGCFWCTEAVFTMLKGVVSARPGYAGGATQNPTYEQVSTGTTGHIEVIEVVYDPDQLSFEEILQVFFDTHDPTTPNRQGNDVGPQYHSAIFYTTPRQKEKAEHYIGLIKNKFTKPIVTTVAPLITFYLAEDYHHQYYEHHKDAPYCELIIEPKIAKVETKFRSLLK